MIKLIKNELKKVFKKKTIYILLSIVLLIIAANTIIGTSIYDGVMIDHTLEVRENEKKDLQNKLQQIDYTNKNEINKYIETKTKLELTELELKYTQGSWQEQSIINHYNELESIIKSKNIYTYQENNKKQLETITNQYNEFLNLFDKNDWREFVKFEIEKINNQIAKLENSKQDVYEKEEIINIDKNIERCKYELEFLNIRLKENISYEISDRNELLLKYKNSKQNLSNYSIDISNMNYKEKLEYNKILSNTNEMKYKIYNNIPILKVDNSRDMLQNVFEFYEILIIIIIVVISTSIVSEEFNKGTIKLLLIKPFSRTKILLSKFITCIIILLFTILFILVVQTILGGIVYGFSDYSIPIIQYNFEIDKTVEINIFNRLITLLLAKLPMYILIMSITFCISTITSNTPLSIIIGILLYFSQNLIHLNENIKLTKYLLETNWDFTTYLYGALPEVEFINKTFSITICMIYFIITMLIAFIVFKKKDVKNI